MDARPNFRCAPRHARITSGAARMRKICAVTHVRSNQSFVIDARMGAVWISIAVCCLSQWRSWGKAFVETNVDTIGACVGTVVYFISRLLIVPRAVTTHKQRARVRVRTFQVRAGTKRKSVS